MSITAGIEGNKTLEVTFKETALAYGSGTIEVFATPAMIALMEQTAMESVANLVPEGFVTVGTEVSVKHLKATLPGKVIHCSSKLVFSEGRKLVFEVFASDDSGIVGKGTHTRYVVDKQSFLSNLRENKL